MSLLKQTPPRRLRPGWEVAKQFGSSYAAGALLMHITSLLKWVEPLLSIMVRVITVAGDMKEWGG